MNGFYNPTQNPYVQQYQAMMQQSQSAPVKQITEVSGENGARSLSLGPNSSDIVLDECGTIVWFVRTDGAGYKTVAPFDIMPHQAAPVPDYAALDARIKKLEEAFANGSTRASVSEKPKSDTVAGQLVIPDDD